MKNAMWIIGNASSHLDAVTTVSQRALQNSNPPGRYAVCASEASAVCTHIHCLPPLADHTLDGKR